MKRIFLSGAISYYIAHGQWGSRKAEFKRVKQLLEQKGWQVVSPLDLNLSVDLPHDRCMEETMKQLAYCHAIYLMDGWEKSSGCRDELNMALATGKEFYFENTKKYDIWEHSLKP